MASGQAISQGEIDYPELIIISSKSGIPCAELTFLVYIAGLEACGYSLRVEETEETYFRGESMRPEIPYALDSFIIIMRIVLVIIFQTEAYHVGGR